MNYIMRKLKIKHLYIVGLICVTCNLLTSCSEDELYSKDQRVYVNSGINGVLSFHLVDSPEGIIKRTLGFPVVSSRELAVDADISFKVDESLLESYNDRNSTEYKILPPNCYDAKNLIVKMKQGEFSSQDSVKIEITKPEEVEFDEEYLLPLTISNLSTDDKGVQISENLHTIYLKIDKRYNSIGRDVSMTMIDSPIGILKNVFDFPVISSEVFEADAVISFETDESLVESYNTVHKTNYKPLQSSCFALRNFTVNMKQGEATTQDLVEVEITKPEALELSETYLLPFVISKVMVGGSEVQADVDKNIIYLKIDKKYMTYSSDAIPDAELMDTEDWSIESSARIYEGNVNNLLDNNPATYWFVSSAAPVVNLDIKTEQVINGFSFCPYYGTFSASTYSAKSVTISISKDGITYEEIVTAASLKAAGNASNPAFNYVSLYTPVKARYLRFNFTNPAGYTGTNLINLYK